MTSSIRNEFRSYARSTSLVSRAADASARVGAAANRAITLKKVRLLGISTVTIGFGLAVVAAAATYGFTSDDVFVQNIIDSLLTGAAFDPVVGGDNFAVKAPLYLLVGALLPNGAVALTCTVLLVNVPLVGALLLLADRAASPRGPLSLAAAYLLVAWFLVSRITPMSSLMIPNGRNGEIGIALLLIAWWCGAIRGRVDLIARGASVLALAGLFFSDGFFLYVLLPSSAALSGLAWIFRLPYSRRALLVTAGVGLAAILSLGMTRAAEGAGMLVLQNYANTIPAAGDLPQYLATFAGSLARDLNADAAGRPLGLGAVPSLLQVGLLCALLVLVTLLIRRRAARDLRVALGVAAFAVNGVLYIATSNASDPYSFRYVLLATVLLVVLGAAGVGELRLAPGWTTRLVSVFAFAGVVAVALGLALNARTVARVAAGGLSDPQERIHRILEIAHSRGLSVGLGDYWDSNITTYLSQGEVRVLPQDCTAGRMEARGWLINRPELAAAARAQFVVINNAIGCTPRVVRKTFGAPVDEVPLPQPGDAVWIYDKDLG